MAEGGNLLGQIKKKEEAKEKEKANVLLFLNWVILDLVFVKMGRKQQVGQQQEE